MVVELVQTATSGVSRWNMRVMVSSLRYEPGSMICTLDCSALVKSRFPSAPTVKWWFGHADSPTVARISVEEDSHGRLSECL